jgi:hypothetical protein
MNADKFIKDCFHDIWEGHAIEKIGDYYAKDVDIHVSVSKKEGEIEDLTPTYDDFVAQAQWQKEAYKDLAFNFKNILASEDKQHISFIYHSKGIDRETGNDVAYRVAAIFKLSADNKICEVQAVVLPFYPFIN